MGGGSVEIALARELGIEVIGYDIFDLLVNYWNVQINKPEQLYNNLISLKNTKEEYEIIKNKLKEIWNKTEGLLPHNYSDVELATLYYFSHNLSYGPGFLGWMNSIYLEDKKFNSLLKKVRDFSAPMLKVFNESFEVSIPKHKNDFLYLDPPYYLEGDSKMFK